jgi:hypothetical protein
MLQRVINACPCCGESRSGPGCRCDLDYLQCRAELEANYRRWEEESPTYVRLALGETPAHTVERIVSMWLLENEDRVAMLGIRLPSPKEHS